MTLAGGQGEKHSKGYTLKFTWSYPQIRVHILDSCISWKVIRQSQDLKYLIVRLEPVLLMD